MSETADPFTQASAAILDALTAFPPFAEMVRLGNRVSGTRRPNVAPTNKPTGAPADYARIGTAVPGGEVRVIESGYDLHPYGSNSKISEAVQSYDVQLATDAIDSTPINRLKWNAMRALLRSDAGGFPLGLPFVRTWTISPGTQQPTRIVNGEERTGWSSAFSVNVEMYWPRASL